MSPSHLARGAAVTAGAVATALWPCLPGSYDPLALPLSMMSRVLSWALLLFVPIGVAWWGRDTFVRRPAGARLLGMVTLGAAAMAGAIVVLASAANGAGSCWHATASEEVSTMKGRPSRQCGTFPAHVRPALVRVVLVLVCWCAALAVARLSGYGAEAAATLVSAVAGSIAAVRSPADRFERRPA